MHFLFLISYIALASASPTNVFNYPPKEARSDEISPHVLPLTRRNVPIVSSRSAVFLEKRQAGSSSNYATPINSTISKSFAVEAKFGDQTFHLQIDTGSSDTWVTKKGFKCLDPTTGIVVDVSQCASGPTYDLSSTFQQIPDTNFNATYGGGDLRTYVTGIVGFEDVTLAGLTIKQEVGIADTVANTGDGLTSGLLGLSFPASTSVYNGTDLSNDANEDSTIYNPIFTSLYQSGQIPPLFSLALDRNPGVSGGLLALGGLAPGTYNSTFTSTPLQGMDPTDPTSVPAYYAITIDGLTYRGTSSKNSQPITNTKSYQVIIDSGSAQNFLPNAIAAAINALFSPPGKYIDGTQGWIVHCTAKPPELGVIINNQTFSINGADMIIDNGDGTCASGVQGDLGGLLILGDVFLYNVVAVFDVGNREMRFADSNFPANMTAKPSAAAGRLRPGSLAFSWGSVVQSILVGGLLGAGALA